MQSAGSSSSHRAEKDIKAGGRRELDKKIQLKRNLSADRAIELIIVNTILTSVCFASSLKLPFLDDFLLLHVTRRRILSHIAVCERTKALFLYAETNSQVVLQMDFMFTERFPIAATFTLGQLKQYLEISSVSLYLNTTFLWK